MLLFTYKFVQKVDFMKSIGAELAGLLLTGIILFSWAGNISATEEHPFLPEGAEKWHLVKQAEFNENQLDQSLFSDIYLPHWSQLNLVKANYIIADGHIKLLIDQNQPGWRPGTKQQISSIQTGMKDGLHIWDSSLPISNHFPAVDNYATKYGYFELRAKAQSGGGIHSAWWMIGDQRQYDKSAEVDIFEILGKDIHPAKSKVWVTIHPWYDTVIKKQSLNYWVNTDVSRDYHIYGFEWTKNGMNWYFDGKKVRSSKQSPDYKMYTLLGIYQSWGGLFSWQGAVDEKQPYPKSFDIDYFRVYKTDEMVAADLAEEKSAEISAQKVPSFSAIFGGDFTWNWYHQPGHLNDNNFATTLQSADNPEFPATIYADFKQTQTLEKMKLYTRYGQGQGVKDLQIEYFDAATGMWKEIGQIKGFNWLKNDGETECLEFKFAHKIRSKHVRVKVLAANLQWKHFAINELQFS